jgi:hypothetical protein
MSDETEDDEIEVDVDLPAPQYVACHNHVILFPWGSEVFCGHLDGLALRIDARDASIEVFDQNDKVWKQAARSLGTVTPISSGKKP